MPEPEESTSSEGSQSESTPGSGSGAPSATDGEKLGDAGMRALEAERKARRDAEARLKELEPLAEKARELEEAQKTEAERMSERYAEAQKEAESAKLAALRLDVALDQAPDGLSVATVRKLAARLQGTDRESLAADAAELFSEFANNTQPASPANKNPRENLTPGKPNPEQDPPVDHEKLAEKILSKNRI